METTNNSLKDFQLSGNISSKTDPAYGDKIITQIDNLIKSSYFTQRNIRFDINERIATGRMNMDVFKEWLDMPDNKKSYSKIIWKSIMIVNTIISRMVGRWMQTNEKIKVKAVDQISVNKKQEAIDSAEFYMEYKEQLAAAQQASGVPMIPQNQFVPDDKDHLDIWTKYELHLPEEYLYGKGVAEVFETNGWGLTGVNRRRVKHNSATFGLIGTYVWADKNGKLHPEWVNPKNAFYSYTEYDDFRDCSFMGQIVSKTFSEIRQLYPAISEKDMFDKIVPQAVEWNQDNKLTWDEGWNYGYWRPYDDWNVDIVMFELKSFDNDNYNMKVTANGNLLIEKNNKKSDLNGDVSRETKRKINIYEGIYVKKNKFQIKWGLKESPVSPQNPEYANYQDFSYSFYMYQNSKMRNLAIPEKVEEPVEQMIITRLKIQQLVAQLRAAGLLIDVDGVQSIDLGTGEGALTPMQLKRVYNQTGDVYYRGKAADGTPIDNPIKELPNAGSVQQLQELITLYNFHLQVVRDETGINEQAEGQTAKPRTTSDNVQASLEISFNATDYMNDACLSLMQMTAKKVACLLHDSVEFGSKEYENIMQEEDVKDRVYDINIEIAPDEDKINLLMQEVNQAIATNPELIMFLNPLKIRQIASDSIDLADVYFRRAQSKALQYQQQQSADATAQNAKSQQDTAQQSADAAMELQKEKAANELALAKERQRELIIQGIWNNYARGATTPAAWLPVEQEIIHNIALPIFSENLGIQAQASQQPATPNEQQAQPNVNP